MTDVAVPTDPSPLPSPRGSFAGVVGRLTTANVVALVAAIIAGPITARALGVEGRGELAAILAVLTVAPWVLDLGVGQWLARERARGGSRSEVVGAALPLALGGSLAGVALAFPLSDWLGQGRSTVAAFVLFGMLSMPLFVVLHALVGLAVGESRWRLYANARIVSSLLPLIAIVALAVGGRLTVTSAAAAYLVGASIGSLLLLQLARGARPLSFDRQRIRAAASFSSKSWLSQVAGTANIRLDQVLMAGLVSSRQLGLYAIAVTVASISHGLTIAVSAALFPRVAEGEGDLAARSCRVTVLLVGVIGAGLVAVSPAMVPFVFGSGFEDAVPMVIILLVASVPLAATVVLASSLVAMDRPAAAMRAELIALTVMLPTLVVFVPDTGGLGAAVISLIAYSLRLTVQLHAACAAIHKRRREFLLPTIGDLRWLRARLRRRHAARL